MGTSRGAAQFGGKIENFAKRIPWANERGVKAASMAYKSSALREGRKDSGGDLMLSRWGRNGVKLGVGFQVRTQGAQASAIVAPRPIGVWSAMSNGTAPHVIAPKRAKMLRIGNRFVRRVNHPGTTGKRTWQRGIKLAEPRAKSVFASAHRRTMLEVFGR